MCKEFPICYAIVDKTVKEILDENIAAAAYELANLKGFIAISEDELNKAKFDLQDLEEKDVALKQFVREVETNNKILCIPCYLDNERSLEIIAKISLRKDAVEPLPLVPAIWTTLFN